MTPSSELPNLSIASPEQSATQEDGNPYVEFVQRYQDDWVGLVRNVFGIEPDKWQADVLEAVQRGSRRISVASGHGVGKSAVDSWTCVCALVTSNPCKVIITAPSGPQLYDALFAEIKMWFGKLPEALQGLFEIKQDRIEHKGAPESIFISCRTSRAETPEALQGVHAEGGRVILIADEASGIPEAVFEAGAGSMAGRNCTTILTGNPTRGSGFFYETHHSLKGKWLTFTVSCFDCSRIPPEFAIEIAETWGEDSNAYRVRVLGLFPRKDDDTLISMDLVQSAMEREIELDPKAQKVWGLDVARFGSDKSVLTKRWGTVVPEPQKEWSQLDLMQTTGAVVNEWNTTPPDQRPVEIMIDVIGIGAGVVDRLRELGLPARGINVSESPAFDPNGSYANLRAELWGAGKLWLEARNCRIPNDGGFYQLTVPKYSFMSNGKMKIESKDELKRRKVRSPDHADSFLLTLAGGYATGMGMASSVSNWSKPLRRNLKGVV